MTPIFIFLIALFCALWIFTLKTNEKKKPANSSQGATEPIMADDSFTPSDLPSNDADIYHHHQDYHYHVDGGQYDADSSDFSSDH